MEHYWWERSRDEARSSGHFSTFHMCLRWFWLEALAWNGCEVFQWWPLLCQRQGSILHIWERQWPLTWLRLENQMSISRARFSSMTVLHGLGWRFIIVWVGGLLNKSPTVKKSVVVQHLNLHQHLHDLIPKWQQFASLLHSHRTESRYHVFTGSFQHPSIIISVTDIPIITEALGQKFRVQI